mmetsp:Transcript_3265/g.9985  ORF Transcript_3265/g.9985 Transcript_3265/m.9985 type:complete len:569 (+) Transcript_3265:91-1797(+)
MANVEGAQKTDVSVVPTVGTERPKADRVKMGKAKADKSKAGNGKPGNGKANNTKASNAKGSKGGIEMRKDDDFAQWYKEVITKGELIDYYDISGCYILRPASFSIWESIKDFVDTRIKQMGVNNCYFPLFVSSERLEKEKEHLEGFSPEVAWVTKSGKGDLPVHIAVRPTSETIMYPSFRKWIRSHRDLPMKINQWSNVVRWEMNQCTPFLRSREFLWQEGHTAFATKEDADKEVLDILDLYKAVYEELLAVPVIQGRKSEAEKFAGALYTVTVEGFIPTNGRAIQGATSHGLGQNFAKMFEIEYENDEKERHHVWQNSWGITTRSIGVMIMIHGDDTGLVLPPRVAPTTIVIVPIVFKDQKDLVHAEADKLEQELLQQGLSVTVDRRSDKKPGYKYEEHELRGVPLRIELGPRDIVDGKMVAVRRDTKEKIQVKRETAAEELRAILDEMQKNLLKRARETYYSRIKRCGDWGEFMKTLDAKCIAICPWCDRRECEEDVKKRSKAESVAVKDKNEAQEGETLVGHAKTLCIPFEKELERLGFSEDVTKSKCFACSSEAKVAVLFGRSY